MGSACALQTTDEAPLGDRAGKRGRMAAMGASIALMATAVTAGTIGPAGLALVGGGLALGLLLLWQSRELSAGRAARALVGLYAAQSVLWVALKHVPGVYANSHLASRLWRLYSCLGLPLLLPVLACVAVKIRGSSRRGGWARLLGPADRLMVLVFGGLGAFSAGLGTALGNPAVDVIGDLYKHWLLLGLYLAVVLLVPSQDLRRLLGGMTLVDTASIATRVPSYLGALRTGRVSLREEAPMILPWIWAWAGLRGSGGWGAKRCGRGPWRRWP